MFYFGAIKEQVRTDVNLLHARQYAKQVRQWAPQFAIDYVLEKVPIIQWLPHYHPRWIVNDIIAGITIGVLLVPQSLAYAKVANIPGQYGLISSWIPTALYAIMGTSKGRYLNLLTQSYQSYTPYRETRQAHKAILDLTAGPTAIMALLTGEIVSDFVKEGYSDHAVATAVAFFVGIYSLAIGLFKFGFVLDFIPLPVLTGYVSAAALTIVIQQVPTTFGETSTATAVGTVIRQFFQGLPDTQWQAFLVGWLGILFLVAFQWIGKRWGNKHKAIWYFSIARIAIVLVLFTGISYGVNKGLETPAFPISKTTGSGIKAPVVPELDLLRKVAGKAAVVWLAAALEHLAIGKSFGRRHNYVIDQSQELTYIGVANFLGSFFSVMPITGGFSRTAVNSESGVKSPLSGLITAACVLVSIYKLAGAFYWIPKATLSAIIITAVWPIIIGPKTFLRYWQISFIDFVASQLSFWVTLFVSVEVGIATAVAFSVVYLLLQTAFSRATLVTDENLPLYSSTKEQDVSRIPEDVVVFKLHNAIIFPNAYRLKTQILDTIEARHVKPTKVLDVAAADRLWNEPAQKGLDKLRSGRAATTPPPSSASLRALILDVTNLQNLDITGLQMLVDLKAELQEFGVGQVCLDFVGVHGKVKERFERANWHLQEVQEEIGSGAKAIRDGGDMVFDILQVALAAGGSGPRSASS